MDSVDSALRYLQRQFASVAHEESAWNEERLQLQQRVRELETERSVQEEAYKDALLRVKMLEFALRQERGRYLVSPAPVISASSSNLPTPKPRTDSAEVSRSVTVSRSMERSKSARNAHSPSPSPATSPKSIHIYRAESSNSMKPSAAKGGSTKTAITKGTEISRPRIPSRSASAHEDTSDSVKPPPKPVTIPIAPKGAYRPHKLKLKLSGHMDGVRSLAFHPTEPFLVSGSEDCTVRLWNLSSVSNGPPSQRATEMDAILTVRTHFDSVLAVAMISSENSPNAMAGSAGSFATAGRDGSICLFKLPVIESEKGSDPYTYEDYQGLKSHTIKRAHEDAVWNLHAHPLSNVLFSSGSDGVVRTWGVSSELSLKSELRCPTKASPKAAGHNFRGSLIPTSAHTMLTDSKTCVIGYTNGALAQFDFHGEQLIHVAKAIDVDTVGRDGQVNQVAVHPTMPIAIAAHNDRKIRMYDMRAGECIGSITAHQDSVATLSIDSSGLYLATGGHDGSLRVWSVSERHCVFEQSAHRPKMGEAVHSVTYHQSRNFIATGGADGTIKIFQ